MACLPDWSEKQRVWGAYRARRPYRVPLRWNHNPRVVLLDPQLNPEGFTFEQYTFDPRVLMTVQARHQEYAATVLNRTCDACEALPTQWTFRVDAQNTGDGSYFGTALDFASDQCPANRPFLGLDDVDAFLRRDFSRPAENPWLRERLAFHRELVKAAADFRYLGRGGRVAPFITGFDGPLTVAAVLMGSDIFTLLGTDPEKAHGLMLALTRAAMLRNRHLRELAGDPAKTAAGWLADDSIQLISTAMVEEWLLPLYAMWYDEVSETTPRSGARSMHLCGDATRHFPLLQRHLGVDSFDTGFPVDHGELRRRLGPNVEISGGPEAALLRDGTPEQCARRAKEILDSGVTAGGRFILQEANNLPPCCPLENLAAVYAADIEHGRLANRGENAP